MRPQLSIIIGRNIVSMPNRAKCMMNGPEHNARLARARVSDYLLPG